MFLYEDLESLGRVFKNLMASKNEKIRYLSAKCFAQFQNLKNADATQRKIADMVQEIFTTEDENLTHSCILFVIFAMKRYESCLQFFKGFDGDVVFQEMREIVQREHPKLLAKERSYYLRSYLLDLLFYLEFNFDDLLVQKFMFCWPAKNNVGFSVFQEKLAKYLTRKGCEENSVTL
jgi:hypothetical protein